ncbi:MAG: hypothetical protein P4L84_12675 [Isosphaeraceae bacterium]|nr:hypothetical protein [Isosphaeraceae bacterium]
MILLYEIEYQLGKRVRVGRRYAGFRAMVAILLDLAVGLAFGLVGLVIGLARLVLGTACRFTVVLLALPFRAARAVSDACHRGAVAKPCWAGTEEL